MLYSWMAPFTEKLLAAYNSLLAVLGLDLAVNSQQTNDRTQWPQFVNNSSSLHNQQLAICLCPAQHSFTSHYPTSYKLSAHWEQTSNYFRMYVDLIWFGTHHVHRITHESLIMTYFQCGPWWSVVSKSGWWSPRQLHIPVRNGGIFYFPWHRHRRILVSPPKDTGKAG